MIRGNTSEAHLVSPASRLQIDSTEQSDGARVLSLRGELDIESAPTLARLLSEAESADGSPIVLDLEGLEFIDSTGLSVLVHARLRAADAHRRLFLTNLPRNVDRIFSITGIRSRFTII